MTMILTLPLLRARYNLGQLLAAATLMAGVVVALIPDFEAGGVGGSVVWAIVYFFSSLPAAISFTLKEKVFREVKDMDIFVVNTLDSFWQLIFSALYFPLVIAPGFGAVPAEKLGLYVKNGAGCMIGHTPVAEYENHKDDCFGMPWPTLMYVVINLAFNISSLLLVKKGGVVLAFVSGGVALPLQNLAFIFSYPLLKGEGFEFWDIIALVIVLGGLIGYRYFSILQERSRKKRESSLEQKSLLDAEAIGDRHGVQQSENDAASDI
eukprot:TRINITY_DN16053_c0_g1_i1.p2 TRINITY_DN16053_c0_g1~~TRINITY_DN16053_c0_g1_i1.p2  ORF type:complete len:265 (-),score=39.75 TRINITY_DN16053_c0_g1_i1:828-1622(-)